MSRILAIRKPTRAEFRRLNELIEEAPTPRQRRKAHTVVLYYTGMNARDLATALGVPPNTVYADLQAFGQRGLPSIQEVSPRGAPARIHARQAEEVRRIAEMDPVDRGEPYGPWSLATLRTHRTMRELDLHYISLPKGCPDDNPVETLFSPVQTGILDSSNDPDARATRRRISAYLRGHNRRDDRWIQISYLPDTHKH